MCQHNNLQHQTEKTIHATLPLDDHSLTPATYRMTIDFSDLNRVTLNDRYTQLPSVQSIEVNVANSLVSTLDIANMFPSILLEESSRDYFNFYYQDEFLRHARLPKDGPPPRHSSEGYDSHIFFQCPARFYPSVPHR